METKNYFAPGDKFFAGRLNANIGVHTRDGGVRTESNSVTRNKGEEQENNTFSYDNDAKYKGWNVMRSNIRVTVDLNV